MGIAYIRFSRNLHKGNIVINIDTLDLYFTIDLHIILILSICYTVGDS